MLRLEAPLVAVSLGFSLDMVEGKGQEQGGELEESGALVGASPRGVMPGTPMSTVDAWNADVGVSLIVVSKQANCGAQVSEGDVDYLACAGPTERPGAGRCGFTTHELGGKDSLKRPVVKMGFLEAGDGFAILMKPSGSTVNRPKIFSLPILARASLPYPVTIDWDLPLTSFKFKAREWKLLIEEYKGASWFASLWMSGPLPTSLVALDIPSPRLGEGFASDELENNLPEETRSRLSEGGEEEGDARFPSSSRGGAPAPYFSSRTDASQRSSRSGGSLNSRPPPPSSGKICSVVSTSGCPGDGGVCPGRFPPDLVWTCTR